VSAADAAPILDAGARDALLAGWRAFPSVLIAVSGGPDSTALLWLAAHWRDALGAPAPMLLAATVDHGLRPEAAAEAEAVGRLCAALGVPHRILDWRGLKPVHGLQEAAREARYALLLAAAREAGCPALALAHTLDDQAETVLFRLARGSGIGGLGAMRADSRREGVRLLRPLLGVPKARLVQTLQAAGVPFVRDPANADPRFARARLRRLAPALAAEGLDARRLAAFAARAARMEAAAEAATDAAEAALGREEGATRLAVAVFQGLPEEIGLRLLGRLLARHGTEGPVELGKLEALAQGLSVHLAAPAAGRAFRRTLAGAMVTVRKGEILVTAAPPRGTARAGTRNSPAIAPLCLGKAPVRT